MPEQWYLTRCIQSMVLFLRQTASVYGSFLLPTSLLQADSSSSTLMIPNILIAVVMSPGDALDHEVICLILTNSLTTYNYA